MLCFFIVKFLIFFLCMVNFIICNNLNIHRDESLSPYIHQHGSRLNHRSIRSVMQKHYGMTSSELYEADNSENVTLPFATYKHFVKTISSSFLPPRIVRGHYIKISNPLKTLSVLEPYQRGGCNLNIRQTVSETSKIQKCYIALNAGYFDTKTGSCLGNVVSDGYIAHDSNGIQNAHFGLTEDGKIFVGYLSEEEFHQKKFKQLVGGVVWILRNNSSFVNASKYLENEATEETGTMDQFVNILSARTVIGHDINGKIVIIQVDGKSGVDGISLWEMAQLVEEFGLVNVINLDGGGSSTLVINGVTVNYPYDPCPDSIFTCDRKVSTILCVHNPYCHPVDCNNHGKCEMGECICDKNWLPPKCDTLYCGVNNCSSSGVCTEQGCICNPGFYGEECNKICPKGWYGMQCAYQCLCKNEANCDPITGECICKLGFTGKQCQDECPYGYFGLNCEQKCQCEGSCICDSITGACDTFHNSSVYIAAKCLAKNFIQEQHLVIDNSEEKSKWYITMIILGIITALCIASIILFMFCYCSCHCQNEQICCSSPTKKKHKKYKLQLPSGYLTDTTSEDELYRMKNAQKS